MPRKGYWRGLDPQPITEREIGLFLIGKVLHAFILAQDPATGGQVNILKTDDGQRYDEELGIWYSPDRVENGVPFEFKTSRGLYMPKTIEDLETYLKQLLIYQAAMRSIRGHLGVLYVNAKDESGKTSPQFRVYDSIITEEEIVALRLQIKAARDLIADSRLRKDHTPLALWPAWACHPEQCVWWAKCKPEGRYENFGYINGKRK